MWNWCRFGTEDSKREVLTDFLKNVTEGSTEFSNAEWKWKTFLLLSGAQVLRSEAGKAATETSRGSRKGEDTADSTGETKGSPHCPPNARSVSAKSDTSQVTR